MVDVVDVAVFIPIQSNPIRASIFICINVYVNILWIRITIKQEHQAPNINRFASSIRAHWDAIWWLAISSLNQNQYALYCIVCAFELMLVRSFVCVQCGSLLTPFHLYIHMYARAQRLNPCKSSFLHIPLLLNNIYSQLWLADAGWLGLTPTDCLFLLEAHCNLLEGSWTICCILQCDKNYKVRLIWHDRLKQHSKMLLVISHDTMAHLYWNAQTWNKTVC